MKKNKIYKGFDKSVENFDFNPFAGRNTRTYTYTLESHENVIRNYTNMKAKSLRSLKNEIKFPKENLNKVQDHGRKKQYEIEQLRNLDEVKSDVTKKDDTQESGTYLNLTESTSTEDARQLLSHHFSEMMRRYHLVLEEKDQEIRSLKEKLARYVEEKRGSRERVRRAHPAVEAQRLRRTEAALQEARNELALARSQLDYRLPCTSEQERAVVDELRRRQHFHVLADLEAMRRRFLQRLDLEERLDQLHWELESRRHEECDLACSHHEELLMLQTTRNNLTRALRELRASSAPGHSEPSPTRPPASISTLQTMYRPAADTATTDAASSLPDK